MAVLRQDYIDLSHQQIFDVNATNILIENLIVVAIYYSNLASTSEYVTLFEKNTK